MSFGMKDEHRQLLRRHRAEMAKVLETDKVVENLIVDNTIDEEDEQNIKGKPTKIAKARELVDIICRKGPNAFKRFVEACEKPHPELAKKLKEEGWLEHKVHAQQGSSASDDLASGLEKVSISSSASDEFPYAIQETSRSQTKNATKIRPSQPAVPPCTTVTASQLQCTAKPPSTSPPSNTSTLFSEEEFTEALENLDPLNQDQCKVLGYTLKEVDKHMNTFPRMNK
ncbi:uncharacterized protein LOC100373670 [Saccoglossus kowalevskii]